MPNRDHSPIVISKFNGLYDRGDDDVCPADHFTVCQNVSFVKQDGPRTRDGLILSNTIDSPRRIKIYRRVDEVPRRLILDGNGQIHDSLNIGTPILTIAGMTDFSAVDYGNRVYISPHDGKRGLPNEVIWVYDGSECRPAAGSAPAGSMAAANSTLSGNIDAGVHLIAVSFETASGYLTPPGPALYASFNATGDRQVDITGIPIGPTGTVARRLLSTRRIPDYAGNQEAYEFYFIPEGRIANNVDSQATVNYFDADLISLADYLFDQMPTIPAGVALSLYNDRIVVMGAFLTPSVAWFSRQNDPESFDGADGFREIAPGEAGGIQDGVEFRDSFYFTKALKSYALTATEDPPLFWKVITIDGGIGSSPNGIGAMIDSTSNNIDRFLVSSKAGLMLFDGSYAGPEFSWKIREIWDRINDAAFHRVRISVDSHSKRFYISVPLDDATDCSHVLVGDFQSGLDPVGVRWSIWKFPTICPAINLDIDVNNQPYLLVCQTSNVYEIRPGVTNDDFTNVIETIMRTAPLTTDEEGAIVHFDSLRLRIRGTGSVQISLFGEDGVVQQNLQQLDLETAPGREFTRLANVVNEKCMVELRTDFEGSAIYLNKLVLYATAMYAERAM